MSTVRAKPPGAAPRPLRTLRADAARNRDRLLNVASAVFAKRGVDAPLEEIARQADVGIGTLYRHFPTRDALIEAVYRRDVEQTCERGPALLARYDPEQALACWMQEFVGYVARKRGMAAALKSAIGQDSELFAYTHRRITQTIEQLLTVAADAGAIRRDVDAQDLMRAMGGICMAAADTTAQDQSRRLVALLMDGLRYGAENRPTEPGASIPARRSGAARGTP